jgi:hypothetical protein
MTDGPNAAALHEAAHAVIAKVVGLRVASASIRPGNTRVKTLHRSDDADADWRLGTVSLAPLTIEPDPGRCASDQRNAFRHAQKVALASMAFDEAYTGLPAAAKEVLEEMHEIAARLVHENIETIGVVAAMLSRHGVLDEAAIDRLVPDER